MMTLMKIVRLVHQVVMTVLQREISHDREGGGGSDTDNSAHGVGVNAGNYADVQDFNEDEFVQFLFKDCHLKISSYTTSIHGHRASTCTTSTA